MPAYELRSGGDVKNKKQSVADLKYRRLTELNARLKEDLDRPRVKVSDAAGSYVGPLITIHYQCLQPRFACPRVANQPVSPFAA